MAKNNFAEEYARELECRRQFNEARETGNAEMEEAARAAHQLLADQIKAKGSIYEMVFRFYCEAQERGNKYLDLNEVIWDDKVTALIDSLREYGIEKFTFSSTWSSAVETAWLFTQNGCRLEGIVEINGKCKAFMSEEYEKAHGYLFSIGDTEEKLKKT